MEIKRCGSRSSGKGPEEYFTGTVHIAGRKSNETVRHLPYALIDGATLRTVTAPGELRGNRYETRRRCLDLRPDNDAKELLRKMNLFVLASNRPAGPQPVHVARRAKAYAISVDTTLTDID